MFDAELKQSLNQLREEATQTAADILTELRENYIKDEVFINYQEQLKEKFADLDDHFNVIYKTMGEINTKVEKITEELTNKQDSNNDDAVSTHTRYDLDHDVIMRTGTTAPLIQVPDPGMFSGKTSETELFCQLCEDTFKTRPNINLPEETKISFVKSRLRDSARNWYLTKYKDNIYPRTMEEVLDGLRASFSNVASYKIAKIKLLQLKHSYGKLNDYIEEFRSLSQQFKWEEEALTLMFFNGLHPRYQEEIEKSETFPTTLESIITKCILIESSITNKNKMQNNKNMKKKNSNLQNNLKKQKKPFNNYNYNNNNNRNNYQNYNQNNNSSNNNFKAQKISSKN